MPCCDGGQREAWDKEQSEKFHSHPYYYTFTNENGLSYTNYHKDKLDVVTKLLCAFSTELLNKYPQIYMEIVPKIKGLDYWKKDHDQFDENRWYEYYKDSYPSLTKEQIATYVRNGIFVNI